MRTFASLSKTIPRGTLVVLVAGAFTALSACSVLGGGGSSSADRGAQLEVRVNNDHGGAERNTVSPDIAVQESSIVTWHIRENRVEVFVAREEGD